MLYELVFAGACTVSVMMLYVLNEVRKIKAEQRKYHLPPSPPEKGILGHSHLFPKDKRIFLMTGKY